MKQAQLIDLYGELTKMRALSFCPKSEKDIEDDVFNRLILSKEELKALDITIETVFDCTIHGLSRKWSKLGKDKKGTPTPLKIN